MSDLTIIISVTTLGFAFNFALMRMMWTAMNEKFEKVEQRFEKIDQRFEKVDEKLTDIDRRVCRIEGALASKDCCILKNDTEQKKAK